MSSARHQDSTSGSGSGGWPAQDFCLHDNPLSEPVRASVDVSRYFKPVPRRRSAWRRALYWLQDHYWVTALLAVLLLGVIVAGVVVAVCSTRECRGLTWSKSSSAGDPNAEPYQDIPRLLVAFTNKSINALDVVPPVLRTYIMSILLQTSGIQLLNFTGEDALAAARVYLQAHPALDFLVRDFGMSGQPSLSFGSAATTSILDKAIAYTQTPSTLPWAQLIANAVGTGDSSGRRRGMAAVEVGNSSAGTDGAGAGGAGSGGGAGSAAAGGRAEDGRGVAGGGTGSGGGGSGGARTGGGGRRQRRQRVLAGAGAPEPDDPLYVNGAQWFMTKIGAAQAWTAGTGSSDVIVAIVDSGVDLTHPDLAPRLWTNPGEIPGNGIDDDGNGLIDDIHGWDFAGGCAPAAGSTSCSVQRCTGQSLIMDASNHGTGVAGLVGAVINNGLGGVGLAPGIKLMVIRVADCVDGTIYASAAVAAFDYAARMGASIVQASFGADYPYGFNPQQPAPWYHAGWTRTYTAALEPLATQGILVVAAAGNEAMDLDSISALGYSYCPCLVQLPNVLCVMSSEPDDSQSEFTNYGNASVHLAAPGRVVVTTTIGGQYTPLTGSSFAAPIVTGVAALALSVLGATDGNYTRAWQVRSALLSSVTLAGGLTCNSRGRVSANGSVAQALTLAANSGTPIVSLSASLPTPPVLLSNTPTSPLQPPSPADPSALASGYMDRYYLIPPGFGPALPPLSLAGLALLDVATRTSPQAYFQLYKYTAGAFVTIRGHVLLGRVGVWGVKVSSQAAASSYRLLVNGAVLPLSAQGQGALLAQTTGLYVWELQMMPPLTRIFIRVRGPTTPTNASSTLQLLDASGGSSDWMLMSGAYSLPATRYQPPAFGPAMSPSADYEASLLSRGWLLRYNVTQFLGAGNSPPPSPPPPPPPPASNATTSPQFSLSSLFSSSGLPLMLPRSLASFLLGTPQDTSALPIPSLASSQAGQTTQQSSSRFMRAARLPELAFSGPGDLQSRLFPTGMDSVTLDNTITPIGVITAANGSVSEVTGPTGLVGWATTVLRSSMLPQRIAVRAMCRACLLLLNDLPVLDGWEPAAATTSTTPTTTLQPRVSGCITLAPGELIRMSLVFATTDMTWSPLVLGWATCETADQGIFQQFADSVQSPDVWDVDESVTGYVPGVQCDAWRSPDLLGPGSADVGLVAAQLNSSNGATTAGGSWFTTLTPQQGPQFKSRLPAALCGGTDCVRPWAFTLEMLFPGLASQTRGVRYNVRCWTYWSGAFQAGPRELPVSSSGSGMPTSIYLAGQQVWSSSWPGVSTNTSMSQSQPGWATVAPLATELDGSFQQLAVEWFDVDTSSYLMLMDGNQVITIDPTSTQLPIPVASTASMALSTPTIGQVAVGPPGHYSITVSPAANDIPTVVETDLSGLLRLGVCNAPNQGLDFLAAYGSDVGAQVRYSTAYGLLLNTQLQDVTITLTLLDSSASSTSILAGGVTLLNARPFVNTSLPSIESAFHITVPAQRHIPVAVVVKTSRPDGRTLFNAAISGGSPAYNGPVDNSVWFQAVAVSGTSGNVSSTGDAGLTVALGIL